MSSVTNLLIIGLGAVLNLEKINIWLENLTALDESSFRRIDDYCGGDKAMETDILGSALNYFERHIEIFIQFLKGLDWRHKTDLFIQKEHEDVFTRIKINY